MRSLAIHFITEMTDVLFFLIFLISVDSINGKTRNIQKIFYNYILINQIKILNNEKCKLTLTFPHYPYSLGKYTRLFLTSDLDLQGHLCHLPPDLSH